MSSAKTTFDPAGLKNDIDNKVHAWLQTMTKKPALRMEHSGCSGGVIWFAVARKNNDVDVYLGQFINSSEKSFQKVYTAQDMSSHWDHWFAEGKTPLWDKNVDCREALQRVTGYTVDGVSPHVPDCVCEGSEDYTWIQCVDDYVWALTFELCDARHVYFPGYRVKEDSQYSSFFGFARIQGKFYLLRVATDGMFKWQELNWISSRSIRQDYATMYELYRLDADMDQTYNLDEYRRRTAFKSFDDRRDAVRYPGVWTRCV